MATYGTGGVTGGGDGDSFCYSTVNPGRFVLLRQVGRGNDEWTHRTLAVAAADRNRMILSVVECNGSFYLLHEGCVSMIEATTLRMVLLPLAGREDGGGYSPPGYLLDV